MPVSYTEKADLLNLPLADHAEIDDICTRFERDWDKKPCTLESFWSEKDGAKGQLLFCELLKVELACRRQRGETPVHEEYIRRFPELEALIVAMWQQPSKATSIVEADAEYDRTPSLQERGKNEDWQPLLAPPQQPDEIGRLGDYRVLELVGRGGMGVVFKAEQASLKRIVALKFLHKSKLAHADHKQRFQTEAETIARLQHPYIVAIHEVGEQNGCPFLSLEYLPTSLGQHLQGMPMAAVEAARLVETLSRTVQTAHDHGVIHRDLKPHNILLTGTSASGELGTPKISDFGLAKQTQEDSGLTETGQILGTPSYMAPEQARGDEGWTSPAVDVYALGAILYELLTGRPPFRAASSFETLKQVVEQEPVPPSRLQPNIPRDLETICLKCLEKKATQRFANCAELADDLRCFLDGKPIKAKPTSPWRRVAKWARRRPALATLMAVLVVGMLVFLGVWWKFTSDLQILAADLQIQRNLAEDKRIDAETKTKLAKQMADLANKRKGEAETQKGRAIHSLKEARQTAMQYLRLIRDDKDLQKQGLETLRNRLLDQSRGLIEKLVAQHKDIPELRMDLSDAYHELAVLAMHIATPDQAALYFQKGIEVDRQLLREEPNKRAHRASLGVSLLNYGNALYSFGKPKEAENAYAEGCRHLEFLASKARSDEGHPFFLLASGYTMFGRLHRRQNNLAGAEQCYRKALHASEMCLQRPKSRMPDYFFAHSTIYNNLGVIHEHRKEWAKAAGAFQKAVMIREQLVCVSPGYPRYLAGLAGSLRNLARFHAHRKKPQQALDLYARVVTIQTLLAETHPKIWRYRTGLGSLFRDVGDLHRDGKETAKAAECYHQASTIYAALTKDYPEKWDYVEDYVECVLRLCSVTSAGKKTVALHHVQACLAHLANWNPRKPTQTASFVEALQQAREQLMPRTVDKR